MADSVRMADSAAMTRGLDEFRRMDQEQRNLGNRVAGEAAAHKVEENRKDVPQNEKASEAQVKDRDARRGSKQDQDESEGQDAGGHGEDESPPLEIDEGHFLDITV